MCGNCGRPRIAAPALCSCVPGWVWREPEVVAAVRERDARSVVRFLRRRVPSLSQEALARMCGVAQSTVARAEAGKGFTDRRKSREALLGLGAFDALSEETGGVEQPVPEPRVPRDVVDGLRLLVNSYDLPEDGPVRSFSALRAEVRQLVGCRLNSHYSCLTTKLPKLVPEVTRALLTSHGEQRGRTARLLVQAYRAADAIADKNGLQDLSARIIQVMLWAADQADDEVTRAVAAYVRGEIFFSSQDFQRGRRTLEVAAQSLKPLTAPEWAAYGALHMRAAVLAARGGDTARARDHLQESRICAERTPEGIYHGTAFGPGSVRIHEVTLALEASDPERALAASAGWAPPQGLPAERASHFHIDIASAHLALNRPGHALGALNSAWRAAPEHTRLHPHVRSMVRRLNTGGTHRSEAQQFARTVGVSVR